jgi:UDP-2-acetamido-2,6-beta-L-arabino-hexul-4-ose reductase
MLKVIITGAKGLLGWHAHARLHAANCAAAFRGDTQPFTIVALDHNAFDDDTALASALQGADAVLHFAGLNRGPADKVETMNPAIARRLASACLAAGCAPHVVYANSTHAAGETPYGRSKREAGRILADMPGLFTDLVLPHIFGEGARASYNNVTATLIAQILDGGPLTINPDGRVNLLHAGAAAQMAIDAVTSALAQRVEPKPMPLSVPDLYHRLKRFNDDYTANVFPDLSEAFDRDLFNTYRAATYPGSWPRPLLLKSDARGMLFEAFKGGGGGQGFLSTTRPGVTRGDHFHLGKVERFVVLQGEAVIRIRKVLSTELWEYRVSGREPAAVDMPTLHTHSIENIGDRDLLTMFWTHDQFDPDNPDTYADKVLQ